MLVPFAEEQVDNVTDSRATKNQKFCQFDRTDHDLSKHRQNYQNAFGPRSCTIGRTQFNSVNKNVSILLAASISQRMETLIRSIALERFNPFP